MAEIVGAVSHKFVFADRVIDGYSRNMSFGLYRRAVVWLTAMLFAVSIAGHSFAIANISSKAPTATIHAMSAESCMDMDCDGTDAAMQLVCQAFCANTVAVLSEPIKLPTMIVLRLPDSTYSQMLPGRNAPPDPFPPRSVVLS